MDASIHNLSARRDPDLYALLGEFRDVDALMGAAEELRDGGLLHWDCHTPFPVHGLDRAMGIRPTILPWIALVHGLAGIVVGLVLVWWTNATSFAGLPSELSGYTFLISGKPQFSLPANIPIIYELAILFAALGTILGMLGLNKLPMPYNPLFASETFRGVTRDRFCIVVEAEDPLFEESAVREMLQRLGAVTVERILEREGAA